MKGLETGEFLAAKAFKDIIIFEQYGSDEFIKDKHLSSNKKNLSAVEKGL